MHGGLQLRRVQVWGWGMGSERAMTWWETENWGRRIQVQLFCSLGTVLQGGKRKLSQVPRMSPGSHK